MKKALKKLGFAMALAAVLWPALAVAKPPDPQGQLVFSDDFSSAQKSGLEDNVAATDYSRGFHAPGVYHLILMQNNDTRWSLFPNQSYSNLTYEMDVWDNSDNFSGRAAQGLVFRATDAEHFYAVLIDPRAGQYTVRKYDGATVSSDIIAWKDSPLIKRQAEVNRLRVDANGEQFTLYVNDEQLDSFTDGSFATGGIGVIASNMDATEPHMHFDNVQLYSSAPMPVAMPNTGAADVAPLQLLILALLLVACSIVLLRRARQAK